MTALDVLAAGVVLYWLSGAAVLVWYLAAVCAPLGERSDALEMATVLVRWPSVLALTVRIQREVRRRRREESDEH